ncbi:hypothetical protein GCM10010346_00880 [Streptomyces chryseus]|uniref:DSBA-like thioredoxin domain-containing protein n=1 Tax=Streptomyces chryseus TaxID=68186 RepID=A0ABQ3DEU7_9ACTN|nr:hypothetical protein GCM10010346_00880 [Streptomyces chryseus]
MEQQVASHAHAEGLAYLAEGRDHGNTFDIHRLLHLARARGRHNGLLDLAYRANFAEERSVFDARVLLDLAVEAGLDPDEARAVLEDESAYADEVRGDEREAAELGRAECRSSCWTGVTGSPAASPPRSSPRRWSRPGRAAPARPWPPSARAARRATPQGRATYKRHLESGGKDTQWTGSWRRSRVGP